MLRIIFVASLLVLLFGSADTFGQGRIPVREHHHSFYSFVRELGTRATLRQDARSRLVQETYDEKFGGMFRDDVLGSLPKEDLHLLFDAASLASFENPDGPSYKDALMALRALGANASDREIRAAQGMLFQSRKFHELDALSVRYADRELAKYPKFEPQKTAGMHEVLAFSGTHLVNKNVEIGRGPRVVVVAHPLCHFTQNAMKAISRNAQLTEAMSNIAVWIAPPDRNMDFAAFSQWQDVYPGAPILTAYSYSRWPELGDWGTPTFYFFEDGQPIETVVGWPEGGRMADLKKGLAKIGIVVE